MDSVPAAILEKFNDRGASGFATIMLPSGERVFLSLAKSGLRIHRLILGGWFPGGKLFAADAATVRRVARVFARDLDRLPALPDWAAMDSFLAGAIRLIGDPSAAGAAPVADDATSTSLHVLARAALAEPDAAALARRFERAAATA